MPMPKVSIGTLLVFKELLYTVMYYTIFSLDIFIILCIQLFGDYKL